MIRSGIIVASLAFALAPAEAQTCLDSQTSNGFRACIFAGSGEITNFVATAVAAGEYDIFLTLRQDGASPLFALIQKTSTNDTVIAQDIAITTSGMGSGVVAVTVAPQSGRALRHVESVYKANGTSPLLQASVSDIGRLGSGGISADRISSVIVREDAGRGYVGDVWGPIVTTDSLSGLEDIIIEGDLLGDIDCSGQLPNLEVSGDIGSSSTTVDISCVDLLEVSAANIWANIDVTGDDANILRLRATGDVNGTIAGREFFTGSGVSDPFEIGGDFNADLDLSLGIGMPVTIGGDVTGDISAVILRLGRTLQIDGSLTSGGSVTLDTSGLAGQIIINGANSSGTWSGDVTVGATTLSPEPLYTNTGLGGGAVGEVPFGLHLQACDPPYVGSTHPTATPAMPADTIDLVHYGPITGSGDLFLVGEFPGAHCSDPCLHGDISNHDDTANWDIVTTSGRTLTIERDGGLNLDKHYHIYPDDDLKSDIGLGGSNPAVRSWEYVIYRNSTP